MAAPMMSETLSGEHIVLPDTSKSVCFSICIFSGFLPKLCVSGYQHVSMQHIMGLVNLKLEPNGNIFWHFQVRPKSWKSHIVPWCCCFYYNWPLKAKRVPFACPRRHNLTLSTQRPLYCAITVVVVAVAKHFAWVSLFRSWSRILLTKIYCLPSSIPT